MMLNHLTTLSERDEQSTDVVHAVHSVMG